MRAGTVHYEMRAGTVCYEMRAGTVYYEMRAGTVCYEMRAGTVYYEMRAGTVCYEMRAGTVCSVDILQGYMYNLVVKFTQNSLIYLPKLVAALGLICVVARYPSVLNNILHYFCRLL